MPARLYQTVLAYLGRHEPYEHLIKVLGTRWFGTPADNVLRLERIGVAVSFTELSLAEIRTRLQANQPVIAFVHTTDLPYWSESADHVVVVVGMDDDSVYLNDPFFEDAPQRVPHDALRLAMLRFDNCCALLALK